MIIQNDRKSLITLVLIMLIGAFFLGLTLSSGTEMTAAKADAVAEAQARMLQIEIEKQRVATELQAQQQAIALQQLELERQRIESQKNAIVSYYSSLVTVATTIVLIAIALVTVAINASLARFTFGNQLESEETARLQEKLTALQARTESLERQALLSRQLAVTAEQHRDEAIRLLPFKE